MTEILPKAAVLVAPGTNCDQETIDAINLLGGIGERVPISDLGRGRSIDDAQMLVIPGGFSYGDHLGSGNVLAQRLLYQFSDQLNNFVEDKKPVLGICNGFQVLVRAGLLPTGQLGQQTISLTTNDSNQFGHRWVRMSTVPGNACVWLPDNMPENIELPVANKEGKFVAPESEIDRLEVEGQVAFRYTGEDGQPTMGYPANPNGAKRAIASICTRFILGLMPHPERFVTYHQYDNWRRFDDPSKEVIPYGRFVIKSMINYVKES